MRRRARARRATSSASGCDRCGARRGDSAERKVEVVAQPAGQRHVPAPPELQEVLRHIRRVEVLRERKPNRAPCRSPCPCSPRSRSRFARQTCRWRAAPRARRAPRGRRTRGRRCWRADRPPPSSSPARWRSERAPARRHLTRIARRAQLSSKTFARTIGPAIRWGKKACRIATSTSEAAFVSPR